MQVVEASTYVAKYAGVVVTDAIEKWQMLPILTTRQDIYTDPQKPVAVEPKLYAVGEVGPGFAAVGDDQFLAELLLGGGRGGGEPRAGLHPGGRHRGHFRADGLGLRQVQRRHDQQGPEEVGSRTKSFRIGSW